MLGPYHFASKSKQELGSMIFFLYGCARSLGWLAVHVQNENLVYMLCQPQDTSSNESLLDSVKATRTKHTKQPQEQSEKTDVFFDNCCAHRDDCGSLCTSRHRGIGRLRGLVTRLACSRSNTNKNKHQNKQAKHQQATKPSKRGHSRRTKVKR